jgi:hypothetical protein
MVRVDPPGLAGEVRSEMHYRFGPGFVAAIAATALILGTIAGALSGGFTI